jgi:hypothetical protein
MFARTVRANRSACIEHEKAELPGVVRKGPKKIDFQEAIESGAVPIDIAISGIFRTCLIRKISLRMATHTIGLHANVVCGFDKLAVPIGHSN